MLCERCQRFDIQAFGRDPYPYRGIPLPSVNRSSSHCSFCSLLLENLEEADKFLPKSEAIFENRPGHKITATVPGWVNFAGTKATKPSEAGSDGLNIASIDVFVGFVDVEDPKYALGYVKFHVAADPGTPASMSQDITGQMIMDRPWSSTKSIESIQTWHRECVSNHPECCKTLSGTQSCQTESTLLPTRCIETLLVATQDDASPWRHVLRETADQRGQYISLSHRWDKETETSKTTPANYMHRMAKCPQDTDHTQPCISDTDWTPRLFVEICILAHSLSIKYVWIDSICIRQGDEEDWNREAPQMARYYQNAWATVVAANNAMANGLLNMRRIEPVPRMARLPYMDRNGEQKGYFYIQSARPDVLQNEFSVGVEKSELLQRGWVFQEWRLSRRIIAFSDSGFFLHCHTLGSMSPIGEYFNGAGAQLGQSSNLDGDIMQGRFPLSVKWGDIVSEYSGLGLTNLAKDRLMALAGVASEVGRKVEASKNASNSSDRTVSDDVLARRYVCGLWLINFHRGLLWEQATRGTRERLPGIPTWSWASMASHITDKNDKRVLVGMSVRWPRRGSLQHQRVYAIHKATTIPVDDRKWLPQFSNRAVPDNVPENEYGNENRFVVLTFHSSLIPVQIEKLLNEPEADLADEMTSTFSVDNGPHDYDLDLEIVAPDHPWGMGLWRGICLPTDPNRITGWVSVEHPEFQSDEYLDLQSDEKIASSSGSIYALFLERCEEKGSWLPWRRALFSRVIFTVLLVRQVSIDGLDESFERVGVGRLFGEEVDRRYSSTAKRTISLV